MKNYWVTHYYDTHILYVVWKPGLENSEAALRRSSMVIRKILKLEYPLDSQW